MTRSLSILHFTSPPSTQGGEHRPLMIGPSKLINETRRGVSVRPTRIYIMAFEEPHNLHARHNLPPLSRTGKMAYQRRRYLRSVNLCVHQGSRLVYRISPCQRTSNVYISLRREACFFPVQVICNPKLVNNRVHIGWCVYLTNKVKRPDLTCVYFLGLIHETYKRDLDGYVHVH